MNLTFYDKKFILTNFGTNNVPSSGWTFDPATKSYYTKNIKAAHAYQNYASLTVKNIFNKLMIKPVSLTSVAPLTPDGLTLKDFQIKRGVPFIMSQNKSYLAHQPGLGKSAQVIAAINTNPGPALICPPSFLKINWAREINKWSLSFPTVAIVQDTKKQHKVDWLADYVICPHSMLSKPWVMDGILKTKFKYKVVDEPQNLKSTGAARSTALWGGETDKVKSPGLMSDCDHEIYLSGTPMLSRPMELYALIYGVAPEVIDFMSETDYGFRYCGAWQDNRGHWKFTGSSREAELHTRLTTKFMQIIRKKDVLKDLPEKIRSVLVMDGDPRNAEAKELDNELMKLLATGIKPSQMRLDQYAKMHHINGLAKVNWATDLVRYYLTTNPDEQIILYGFHRDVCQLMTVRLRAFGFKPDLVLGGIKPDERTKIIDRFQSRKSRIIVGNESMKEGFTLSNATRTIHAEYSTLPGINEQMEDRANRIGAVGDYSYHQYIVLPEGTDPARLKSFHKRNNAVNKVIY